MEEFERYFDETGANLYCRFCLKFSQESEAYISLFTTDWMLNDSQAYNKLFPDTLFDVDARQDITLSSYICEVCHEGLNSTVNFLKMVSMSEQTLQQAYEKFKAKLVEKSEIKDEPISEMEYDECDVIPEAIIEEHIQEEEEVIKDEESKPKIYICDFCSETFTSKHKCSLHMRTHQNTNKKQVDITKYLICELCDPKPTFPAFVDMSKHYKDIHGVRGYAVCCKKKFFIRSALIEHEEVHLYPLKYNCNICNRTYGSKRKLDTHNLIKHTPDSERKFKCHLCPKKYFLNCNLKQHIKLIHVQSKEERKTAKCHVCGKKLSNKHALDMHLICIHNIGDIPWKVCDQCGYKTRHKGDLMLHIRSQHTNVPEGKQCTICGVTVKYMNSHMRLNHLGQRETCKICGHQTKNNKAMNVHMKSHSNEK